MEQEVHKVQILDPATGTGTFLAEVVKHIHKKFEGQQGIWSNYVETHLLPRLNGFELLMASYAMAHLKLDLLLTETGFKPTIQPTLQSLPDQQFRSTPPRHGNSICQLVEHRSQRSQPHQKRYTGNVCDWQPALCSK
ncbi:MAG: hypothetical protein ACOXZK_02560 [Bacteroidales bacterium]